MKKYFLLVTLILTAIAFAETSDNISSQSINRAEINVKKLSDDKRTLVIELLQLVNTKKQSREILDSMIKMLPSDVRETFKKALNPDEMMELVIPVYEKYLTTEDLESIIKFYKSPAGKKLLEAQPKIMKDSMIVMKVYAQKKLSAAK